MTPTEHLIGFIAMASAIVAILVLGTLAAADILHFGRREAGATALKRRQRAENLAQAFTPLGASLTAGYELRTDARTEPEATSPNKDLAPSTSGRPSAH